MERCDGDVAARLREVRVRAVESDREVEFVVEAGGVRLVKARDTRRPSRGAEAVARLRRSGRLVTMTTDEIMALTRGND